MPRMTRLLGVAAALTFVLNSTTHAQASRGSTAAAAQGASAGGGFRPGYTDIGPVIGLGGIGSASISLGGRFEHGIKTLPSLSNGVLGIEVSADWWHWNGCKPYDCSVSYIPIGATANYHFHLENNTKFDPFIGLGLGFEVVSCSGALANYCGAYSSGIYFIGRAGARYFMSSSMALYGDVGAGAATLNVGLTFKMKGGQ